MSRDQSLVGQRAPRIPCSHAEHAHGPREARERSGVADEVQASVTEPGGPLETDSSDAPGWPEDRLRGYMKSPKQPAF